jgi:hypothetical protein
MLYSRLAVLVLFAAALTLSVAAQTGDKPLTKEILARIAAEKAEKGPFVLITPADLAGYSLGMFGDPCDTAAPIAFGQMVNGALTNSDCQLDDGSYADFYFFNGTATQQVTINMSSAMFDTYLGLANESGTFVVEDDDGGGGTNSRIIANLPETGLYFILANAFDPNTFGNYSLSLQGSTVCTYSLEPTSSSIPGAGGTFTFNVITQPGCGWSTSYDIYGFLGFVTSGGIGNGTVSYTAAPNNSGANRSAEIRINNVHIFTVNQTFLTCTYSISPTSAQHGPDAIETQFMMNTPEGCPWTASYSHWWVWTSNELKRGPGPVVYTLAANNGADRSGSITVAGHTFSVTQTGRSCTYSVSPTSLTISPAGTQNGQFAVDTQPGCTWSFSGGFNYIYYPDGNSGGNGPGVKNFVVWPNHSFAARNWIVQFNGISTTNIAFAQNGIPFRTHFDFWGDSKADLSIFRPSTGEWILGDSSAPNALYRYTFGLPTDIMVPADFNGDRTTDIAVFRPSDGTWYIYDRATGSYSATQFGSNGDIPAPADFDGDGRADLAVFRPSNGLWYILRTSSGEVEITQFGKLGDLPVAADYDGDRKADLAIWRPELGQWWIRRSSDGSIWAGTFGIATDKAVPGDHTGDGKADIAIYRPSNGNWYVLRSEDYSYYSFPFGLEGDVPVPADYDADGIIDPAVFRPSNSTWYIKRSALSVMTVQFGSPGDVPTPSAFVR